MPRKVGPLNKMAMDAALDTPLVNHRLRATARFCHAEVSKQFTLVWAARGCSISICKTCFSSLSGGQRMMFVHDAPPAGNFAQTHGQPKFERFTLRSTLVGQLANSTRP